MRSMESDFELPEDVVRKRKIELDEVAETIDLSPAGIEASALKVLYSGLCRIRLIAHEDPERMASIADSLHNIPLLLGGDDYEGLKYAIAGAVLECRRVQIACG